MTIEPASPKPGEQITVVATMSADIRCCEAALTFHDGEVGGVVPTLVEPPNCMTVESVTPRTIRAVKTHTYQASGRELVTLYVVSWPCIDRNLFPGSIGPADIRSVGLDACIEVQGPRSPMLPPCPR